MVTFDPIPQARIVRQRGQSMTPPRAPRTEDPAGGYVRIALTYAIGLWPLTAVVLLTVGLLVLTAHLGAP